MALGVFTQIPPIMSCSGYYFETLGHYKSAWYQYHMFSMNNPECVEWISHRKGACLHELKQWSTLVEEGKATRDVQMLTTAYSHMNQWE